MLENTWLCGTEGTSWATTFQPIPYTLGGAKLENSSVANLDVYPNPSRTSLMLHLLLKRSKQ